MSRGRSLGMAAGVIGGGALLVALALIIFGSPGAKPAPGFTLSTPAGVAYTLPEAREGVDIYYFWATWCPFCRQIKPYMQALIDDHGDSVRVFAINFREYEDRDPAAYLSAGGWDFTLLLNGEQIADEYGAWVLPGIYIVDGQGQIRWSLYDNPMPNPDGYERLSSAEQATIRAPWWGARLREAVEALL
jgi:thiol-disulfide isomerase/thioredoxin